MIQTLKTIITQPYRVFFLVAGLYAVFAMFFWELWLGAAPNLSFGPAAQFWHAHEMIFGYTSAALGGFLLTAVPNWTNSPAVNGRYVASAAGLWLAGRLALWFAPALSPWLVMIIDLAFLPVLAAEVARMLIKRPKPQNVVFVIFITLIWIGNLMVHLEWVGHAETLDTGLRVGLLGFCLMIAVIGGRVTPAFTRNALKRDGLPQAALPHSKRPFDLAAMVLIAILPLALILNLPPAISGTIAIAAGVIQLMRIRYWGLNLVLGQPILWTLHLGMGLLGAGLILWGLSLLGLGDEVAAVHLLGIGAVGGMSLAVMSRAVLGHTGRPLSAPPPVALAYGLLALVAVLRWLATLMPGALYHPMLLISGVGWTIAFLLYVLALWPAFTSPRRQ